jgi:hypothetical protein
MLDRCDVVRGFACLLQSGQTTAKNVDFGTGTATCDQATNVFDREEAVGNLPVIHPAILKPVSLAGT